MVRILRTSPLVLAAIVLAGCSAQPPAPSPTPPMSESSTPPPSASAVPLASTDAVSAAVNDADPAPAASFVSTVDGTPAVFENTSALAPGSWATRFACSSATGANLAIVIELPEGGNQEFSAPCGVGSSIVTGAGPSFTSASTYRITATSDEPAVVAVGLVAQ